MLEGKGMGREGVIQRDGIVVHYTESSADTVHVRPINRRVAQRVAQLVVIVVEIIGRLRVHRQMVAVGLVVKGVHGVKVKWWEIVFVDASWPAGRARTLLLYTQPHMKEVLDQQQRLIGFSRLSQD